MGVVDPPNQLPEDDPQLPLNDPLSAPLGDPLSEFAPEPTARRERLLQFEPPPRERVIEFDPDWRGPGESDRGGERALAPALSAPPHGPPKRRWLFALVMLGAGLVAGFAGGVAVVTKYGGNQSASTGSLTSSRAEVPGPAIQEPAVTDRTVGAPADPAPSTVDPVAPAANEVRPNVVTPDKQVSEPPISGQSTPREPTPTPREPTPSVTVTGLYVQSTPAGADVYLDEQLVSTTPFQLSDVAPGQHTIRIDMQGYRPWSMPVTIQRGVRTNISAVLER